MLLFSTRLCCYPTITPPTRYDTQSTMLLFCNSTKLLLFDYVTASQLYNRLCYYPPTNTIIVKLLCYYLKLAISLHNFI